MFCAWVRNQLTAPACPQALLGVNPPRSGCRQLVQEYYFGNMPKAYWWDPWKSVYQLCKWSLNIADLCLKLRLHYAQLRLLPKQLLVCWPELHLIFGSKSQKLCPQCSEDCAEETFSFCPKSLTLPEQKDIFFCIGKNSLLVYYQQQSLQLRGGTAQPSLWIHCSLVHVQIKLQSLRKNTSSHPHRCTLLTSFYNLVS